MTENIRSVPAFSDPLGETLHLLKLTGTLYSQSELTSPWGIDLPVFDDCMMFHFVSSGHCWLEVDGEEPRLLRQGSLALLPHGNGHSIRSEQGVSATPLFDIPVDILSERFEIMRHGGGGEPTQLTCGVVKFDYIAAQRLLNLLPTVLQVDAWGEEEGSWLHSSLRLIASEANILRPGGETMLTHLADIIIIQAIRNWIDTETKTKTGWLAALRDAYIGKAITTMHRAPEQDWSVDSLAKEVGMSRSGFSARFTKLVEEPVMHYLTSLRMQLARVQLLETDEPLVIVAEKLGYQSEAAFCRAFKRTFGESPGAVRSTI